METNKTNAATTNNLPPPPSYTTYVFDLKEDEKPKKGCLSRVRHKIWQIFPAVCGSTICIPFGLMLGWPSPIYPTLISTTSIIPISVDQSAMIAGFLMLGNSFSTPFSTWSKPGAKYGLLMGIIIMLIGWGLLWLSRNIYWLLISRFLVGTGHGFALGQLRTYINELVEPKLAPILIKMISLYTYFGIIIVFCIGSNVGFRQLAVICCIITVFVMFLALFLPSTPVQLLKSDKLIEAKKLLTFLNPNINLVAEVERIQNTINKPKDELTFWEIVKNPKLRKNLLIFGLLIICQQFSGAPATLIYSQIMFRECNVPQPDMAAIIYSIIFFLANIFAIFTIPVLFSKRNILLLSSFGVAITLLIHIVIIIKQISDFWGYVSLLLMIFYIIFHTIGLGNIPFTLISAFFPENARISAIKFFVIVHSIMALIITKIFQVMFSQIGIYAPFCLFFTISVFSIGFILIFLQPQQKKKNVNGL